MEKELTLQQSGALLPQKQISLSVLQNRLTSDGEGYKLSLYKDEIADEKYISRSIQNLSAAFPMADAQASSTFYALLSRCVQSERFTKQRLHDAVMNIIKHFRYKQFNISDIVDFDKRVKLYTYSEMCRAVTSGKALGNDFIVYCHLDNGNCLWYNKDEYSKLMLER